MINKKNTAELGKKNLFLEDRISVIHQFDNIRIKYEDSKLNKAVSMVDLNNLPVIINKFSNKLILFIPDGVCHLCYEGFYADVKKMEDICGKNHLAIFVPASRLREFKGEFGTQNKNILEFVHGIDLKKCGLPLSDKYLLFMFYLDENLDLHNLFIPNKNIPKTTIDYTKEISDKYFTKNEH